MSDDAAMKSTTESIKGKKVECPAVILELDGGEQGIVVQLGRLHLGLVVGPLDKKTGKHKIEAADFFDDEEQAKRACRKWRRR